VLQAFAEALVPPANRVPGAEGPDGVPVVDTVAALLGRAPARVRLAARSAFVAFELSSFPHRFSRLDVDRRSAHLRRIEGGAMGLRRELLILMKSLVTFAYGRDPAVASSLGVEARCRRAGGGAANLPGTAPALDRASLRCDEGIEGCDVVIVGSGAGGAAAARTLAERGLHVIVVEQGSYHDAASYSTDPLDALATLYREAGLTVCEGRPAIPLPLGRCVGGTTVINSGSCFRTPADVLAGWRDRYGVDWAPELEREFESLERDLLVKPVDPETAGRNAELCRAGAEALGASNGPIARNAGDVVCCGTCPNGCRLDAKQAAHVSELPRAVAAGCAIRAGARVESVTIERGRATGVRARLDGGGSYDVRARAVVLAGGAIGTPELLLTQGVAGSSRQTGRNLKVHPACWVGARFDDEVRGWDGVMQSWYVDEWGDRGLFLEATFTPLAFAAHWLPGAGREFSERVEQYGNLAIIGVHLSERSSRGRVRAGRGGTRIGYRLSQEDVEAIRYGIARAADIHFAAGAVEVYPQLAGLPVIGRDEGSEPIERAKLKARDLRLEAFHPMGTARMGADSSTSVVSPAGEAHDVGGLYIVDASIFPTSLRVNPMITVMGCARRIAGKLAEHLS
jgi:choline dehydrogenase-like flavoprotein